MSTTEPHRILHNDGTQLVCACGVLLSNYGLTRTTISLFAGHVAELHDDATIVAPALREFVQWVASNRAYNGSDHEHGQSLYNECLNGVLGKWAEEWIEERV